MLANDPVEIEIVQMALDGMELELHCDFFTNQKKLVGVFKKHELHPDCIIIDSDLGDSGRKDCLKKIKNIDFVSKIPIVFFSGLLSELEIAKLTELGAYGFIPKANSIKEIKTNLLNFFTSNFNNSGTIAI